MSKEESTVTPSSGNVSADMGLPDAEEMLPKAKLASAIQNVIKMACGAGTIVTVTTCHHTVMHYYTRASQ